MTKQVYSFDSLCLALRYVQERYKTSFSGNPLVLATTYHKHPLELSNLRAVGRAFVWHFENADITCLDKILKGVGWGNLFGAGDGDSLYCKVRDLIATNSWARRYTCTFMGEILMMQPLELDALVKYTDMTKAAEFNRSVLHHNISVDEESLLELEMKQRNYFALGKWNVDYEMIGTRYEWECWDSGGDTS